ncbi:MAG: hypothetical protein HOP29_15625 [Phycisphaerales bacterium]|nr:hypothetical protein [Phycisphaerales bacterium]
MRRPPYFLLSVAAMALAGCQTPSERRSGARNVELRDMRGYVELVARAREQDQRSKVGAGDDESRETIFEESIRLDADGYVYHPNFLEFALGGLVGLIQRDNEEVFDTRERSAQDDGTFTEFDLNGQFFKKKPYPGNVFASRHRRLEPRPFLSSLETTTTNFGLTWQYVHPKAPTSIQFSDTRVILDPLSEDEEKGEQHRTSARLETGYRFSEHSVLSFVYDRQSVEEKPFALDFESDELTLSHRYDFGESRRHRLESELNFFDQAGTFDIRRLRWRETMRLQHTESLRSWYVWEAMNREQGSLSGVAPINETSYALSGVVEHQLYDSLTTQALGFIRQQVFDGGPDIDRFGGQVSWDYRKKNPWGVLQVLYLLRSEQEDRSSGDRDLETIDERRTFNDPEPIVISGTDILLGTLRVTDDPALTVYRPGDDYRVESFPDRIELRRVPTGRIADGQLVLIDYVSRLRGSFTLDTAAHRLNVQQDFTFGLKPYYRLVSQDQTLAPSDATQAIAEDITAHTIGAEYERGPIRLTAEYEDHESTINPFRAMRLAAGYTRRLNYGATASLKARWSQIEHDLPERVTRFLSMEGRYRHPITRELTVEGAVVYRTEDDTLGTDDEGVDVDLSLEWLVRQLEVRVTYEFSQFENDFNENDSSIFYMQVRRRF